MDEFSIVVLSMVGCVFATSAVAKLRSRPAYSAFRDGLTETRLIPRRMLGRAAASLAGAEVAAAAGLVVAADGYRGAPSRGMVGRRSWMIKRVAAVPGDARPADSLPASAGPPGRLVPPGRFVVLGDNAAWSHDSR